MVIGIQNGTEVYRRIARPRDAGHAFGPLVVFPITQSPAPRPIQSGRVVGVNALPEV
jgi:hypothetical protein